MAVDQQQQRQQQQHQQQPQDTKSKKKNLKFIETNHEQGWNSRKTF